MREIQITYKEACRNYTFGFATALFMASSSVAYILLLVYKSGWGVGDYMFIVYYNLGIVVLFIGYKYPMKFYELMEAQE